MGTQYFFQFGKFPHLSFAGLLSVLSVLGFDYSILTVYQKGVLVDIRSSFDVAFLQSRLGGTVRIVRIEEVVSVREFQSDPSDVLFHIFLAQFSKEQKNVFGVSMFRLSKDVHKLFSFTHLRRMSFNLKKQLRASAYSVRVVLPDVGALELSSASVYHHRLHSKGLEICLLLDNDRVLIGKTASIQDVDFYSARDYGRPKRDMKVGMIPVKLAQMMLNIAGVNNDGVVLDPFCGFGTIVQEGLLMGYSMYGSDFSPRMVSSTRKNLGWLCEKYPMESCDQHEVIESSADAVSSVISGIQFDAVVTEGTLGPLFDRHPSKKQIQNVWNDLQKLYVSVFRGLRRLLKDNGVIVLSFPTYGCTRVRDSSESCELVPFIDELLKSGYSVKKTIPDRYRDVLYVTERGTLLYYRKDQIVGREIVVFEKQ